jgi:hypothetical protein
LPPSVLSVPCWSCKTLAQRLHHHAPLQHSPVGRLWRPRRRRIPKTCIFGGNETTGHGFTIVLELLWIILRISKNLRMGQFLFLPLPDVVSLFVAMDSGILERENQSHPAIARERESQHARTRLSLSHYISQLCQSPIHKAPRATSLPNRNLQTLGASTKADICFEKSQPKTSLI